MNNVVYKPRPILSPIQPLAKPTPNTIDVRNQNHPIHEEIRKLCDNSFNISVSFEEDVDTLHHFRHIPGMVAILCTLKQNDKLVALGRSCSVLSPSNRYVDRVISGAIGGSFLSAANGAMKILETLRVSETEEQITQKFQPIDSSLRYGEFDLITPKQKDLLQKLIAKIPLSERQELQNKLNNGRMTREEASDQIKELIAAQ